jgi:hypothetical protein
MGNLLSAIGRSQAIPQFLEQARLARKEEAGIALEQEKLGLLRNQDRRAEIAGEGQNALSAEQLRIEKVKAQEIERVKAEGDKLVTIGKAQENLPTKGMSGAMINDLRRRGHLIEEGVAEPSVTQRNLDAYAKRINTKSDTYDPVTAHEAASGHLTSTRQYLDTMKQAASDPKIFKAMQEQIPDLKSIKFEEMQGVVKDAQAEYEAANNVFFQITEKDKIMRQEAADKQQELIRHNKEVETALKMNASANKERAGASANKPEYTHKQALSRTSQINSAISRLKSTGTIDTATAIQNPALAALVNTKDPEAVKQALDSLEQERDYISDFLPTGTRNRTKTETGRKPPAGYIDSGKTSGGKRVYVKGNQAWVE